MPLTCAVIMAVGPGEQEAARAVDVLESAWYYEPAIHQVVLVDDDLERANLRTYFTPPTHCTLMVIPNPRRGRGVDIFGGLCVATLTALRAVSPECDFVLKLDTDSLVIAPFAERVLACLAAHPDAAIIGHYRYRPSDTSAFFTEVHKRGQWVALRRHPRAHVALSFFGDRAFIRRTIAKAFAHRYVVAEHCQGGGYAVSRAGLNRLRQEGCLANPLAWLDTQLGEDVCLGICVRAMGMSLADASAAGGPFAVDWQRLPAEIEELVSQNRAIIHSLKTDPPRTEEQTRAFFKARRTLPAPASDTVRQNLAPLDASAEDKVS